MIMIRVSSFIFCSLLLVLLISSHTKAMDQSKATPPDIAICYIDPRYAKQLEADKKVREEAHKKERKERAKHNEKKEKHKHKK